jgi:hypothetical protein
MAGIKSAKANKNQTAQERAALTEALSGKKCSKCGKDIKIKELLNVQQVSVETGRKSLAAYHRACYAI